MSHASHIFKEPLPGTMLAVTECKRTVRYSETIAARGWNPSMAICRDCAVETGDDTNPFIKLVEIK